MSNTPSTGVQQNAAPGDLEVTRRIAHGLNQLADTVHALAKAKGWYDKPRTDGESLALIHSEVSEMLEEIRVLPPTSSEFLRYNDDGKPEGLAAEAADVLIRLLDYCSHKRINIGEAVFVKYIYNRNRSYRHGGKQL